MAKTNNDEVCLKQRSNDPPYVYCSPNEGVIKFFVPRSKRPSAEFQSKKLGQLGTVQG